MLTGQPLEGNADGQQGPSSRPSGAEQSLAMENLLRGAAARKLSLVDTTNSLVLQQQQQHGTAAQGGLPAQQQLPHSSAVDTQGMLQQHHSAGITAAEHAAAQDGRLARDPALSFSGWSGGPGQLQHRALHPHPPGDYSSGSGSHLQRQQQHDGVSPPREPYQEVTDAAAAAAAAHCSLFAAGALGLRARRKSTSDAAPHHVPYPLAPQRRKSDGGLHGSMLSAQHPLFLVVAAAADGSSHSHSSGSSPDLQTSVVRDMYLHSDARSTGSVSSQHHHLDPISEGVPVTNFEVTPSASPGRQVSEQDDQEYQQEQQDLLVMQRELLQLQQMAQQKELQLQQLLLQQQHNRQSPVGAAQHRHSPTPPGHGSGLPGICVSPRASAFLYKQAGASSSNTSAAGGISSSSNTRRAATEPPVGHTSGAMGANTPSYSSAYSGPSPGAAAMVMTSSSMGRQSQQQQQQLRQAQLEAANAIAASAAASASPAAAGPGAPAKVQPVARDITQRLQMQRPAGRGAVRHSLAGAAPEMQHSEIWAAWEGHQLAGSAVHGSLAQLEQQAQGQPQAALGFSRRYSASSACADPAAQQQQQQELLPPVGPSAAGVRSRPAPQRSHSVSHIAKSPAPPRVPPSPQQQQAAELRTRRSSCSQIPTAPSPRSVLSQGDWARNGEPGSVMHGQQQLGRGNSDAGFPKLALRVGIMTESEGDSLWDNCFRGQISPSRSPTTSGQPYAAHQQQGGTDFLSMQEQRLQRDQAQTAAAGLGSLAAEGSLKDTVSSRRDADSTQQQQPAGVKGMAGQLLGLQKVAGSAGVGAAALPPPHPPSHQHNDVPCTPRGHMMLNPQHTAPRSASAVLSSAPGLQLPHLLPQQPVPPRQHAPSARSPCVATRMHVAPLSPAAAAWLGNNGGAFAGHSTCSPILEQGPYGASSNPSSSGSARVGTASDDRVSPALAGSHLSSSSSTFGLGLSGTGSSISITPGTGGSGSSSARINLSGALPRPAFDQLARSVSMDSSFLQQQQQPGMRSPSPPTAPDATAAIHGCSRPLRALSPVVKKAPAGCTTPTVNLSSSRARQHMQQRLQEMQIPKSPSPPPMGAAAMIAANPRGGAHAVQPCPPLNSLPPVSPSPSVRTRVLTQHGSQAAAQPALALQAGTAAGAGAQAGGVDSNMPEWAGSSPLVGVGAAAKCALTFGSAPSVAAARPGAAAAVPRAGQGRAQDLVAVRRPAQLLQPMPAAGQAASGSGTPDMSWMQTAGTARHAPSRGLLQDSVQDASAVAAAALAGRAAGPAAAEDPVGWQAAAVVAFSHYRGRLGYLMNSGVVGVKFEDGCTMLMQGDMRCVCYLAPGSAAAVADTTAAARPAGLDASPAGKDKRQLAGGAAVAGAGACSMGRRISTDLGQSDQSAGQHSAQAAAEGTDTQASAASKQDIAAQLFQLPDQLASTPSSSDVAGPSDSSSGGDGGVPDHLASKVRCMQRFVGCLLHHQPYSSKRHLDVTRLALPGALGLQQQGTEQDQQHGALQPGLGPSCVHVQHFSYSEGCALLTLTDGSQQVVFISDSSVMLLHPGLRQLGYVTPPRRHKHRSSGAGSSPQDAADAAAARSCSDSACSGSDTDSSSGEGDTAEGPAAGGAQLLVLKLGGPDAVAGQRDPRLLARLKQASRLPGVLPMPFDL